MPNQVLRVTLGGQILGRWVFAADVTRSGQRCANRWVGEVAGKSLRQLHNYYSFYGGDVVVDAEIIRNATIARIRFFYAPLSSSALCDWHNWVNFLRPLVELDVTGSGKWAHREQILRRSIPLFLLPFVERRYRIGIMGLSGTNIKTIGAAFLTPLY